MAKKKTRTEEFVIDGDKVVAEVKKLVHEGNIRSVTLKNEKGETLLEIPMTAAVIGAALLPILAAVGALAAMIAKFRIVVEKVEE